jgi:pyruvate dehydrogenase E1 component
LNFVNPAADSKEMAYLTARRAALGSAVPRRVAGGERVAIPALSGFAGFAVGADGKEMSTTMAIVRMLSNLLRDKVLGPRIVPIVADEARTFGMAGLFRQIGIYSPMGQLYTPEDSASMLAYREAADGQLLEEGITEAGAVSSWVAAATAYSVSGQAMLPFYIYYSMFGFQRVGDLIWAAADQRSRGFLIGATAGRTTLGGEGLQHQDGSSHLIAATVPNCRAYDPAFAGEVAVILDHGARQMMEEGADVFYYITVMNENYSQPSLPVGVEQGVIKGMYRLVPSAGEPTVRLLGSGAILREVVAAQELLRTDWSIDAEVWSVTSFSELAREAREASRASRLGQDDRKSYVAQCLPGSIPVVAATDYVTAYPSLIAPYLEAPLLALGTDGFGRSDTRANLRKFFEVDRYHVTVAALQVLANEGQVTKDTVGHAVARYRIDTMADAPWLR